LTARQRTLWDELERELPPELKQVRAFLDALEMEDLIRDLEKARGNGRDDYPVRPMLSLVLVQPYLRHARFSQLLGELRRNGDLARLLGFEAVGPNQYKVPSQSVLSRFHTKLTGQEYLSRFDLIHQATVRYGAHQMGPTPAHLKRPIGSQRGAVLFLFPSSLPG
jgi:hypothetical protein